MMDEKNVWTLTEDEHDRLAARAWWGYQISAPIADTRLWGQLPLEDKRHWLNAVTAVLMSISEQHGLDTVVVDYD